MNQKLVLIDGHAILHRAYHALPPLTNTEGTQTNAVYGFMTMLLRILEDLKPTHLAVAFDLPQPTFRQQKYTAYQAKRPEMGDGLKPQIGLIHELLDVLRVPYYEVAGYEADDVIGTLALQASRLSVFSSQLSESGSSVNQLDAGSGRLANPSDLSETENRKTDKQISENRKLRTDNWEVVVVTGDRDMLQLVNDRVKICVPVKGLSQTVLYDRIKMFDEFGIKPEQWVDVKALKGDASDNYPGVRGIGPKTAEKLISQYGSLENLYGKLGELGKSDPKTAKKLAEGAEAAGLSQMLAKIVCDVPIKFEPDRADVNKFDWKSGVEYMKAKLGFKSLIARVEKDFLKVAPPKDPQLKLL